MSPISNRGHALRKAVKLFVLDHVPIEPENMPLLYAANDFLLELEHRLGLANEADTPHFARVRIAE